MRAAAVTLAVLLAAPPAAFAASAGTGGIAYVNYERLTTDAPQVAASRRLVQKEFAPRRKAVAQKRSTLEQLRQRVQGMGPGTNPLQRAAAAEKFRHARAAFKKAEQQYETALHLRENQLQENFRKLVDKEIAAYAHGHGVDVVLRDGVHYASATVNITDAILARLKSDYRQAQASDKGHS